jgi:large subunit ribosomal protein L35
MPKQKTHKGAKKRFRVTGTGKVKHRQCGTSHLATRMSAKRKRHLRGTTVLDKMDADRVLGMLKGNSY